MRVERRLAALALMLLPVAAAPKPDPQPVVEVTGGRIQGTQRADGAGLVFRGIPFAASPAGDNRWRAPQPVAAWKGVRDATRQAPACIQADYGWTPETFTYASEDCLTLNVGTPALTGKRPVMVWIHGGSNYSGGARDTVASALGARGIVLVTIQYRLGILGFLSHRGLAREQGGSSGNYGLMDQIAALRWVRANIARFGGDPAQVTIFGESAGSQDVSLLLASPAANGLFARAIMESGTPAFGLTPRPLDQAVRLGDQVDALLDSGGDIDRLRRASVVALLGADLKLYDPGVQTHGFLWLRPTIDGAVLPRELRDLYAKAPRRAVVIGSNRAEFEVDGGVTHLAAAADAAFGEKAARARAFYRLDEPAPPPDPRLGERVLAVGTDIIFRCPAERFGRLLAAQGWPVWRYEFDLAKGGGMSSHTSELPYVFDGWPVAPGLSLQDYWVNFASTSDPNGAQMPPWPAYAEGTRAYLSFAPAGIAAQSYLRAEPCDWMDRL